MLLRRGCVDTGHRFLGAFGYATATGFDVTFLRTMSSAPNNRRVRRESYYSGEEACLKNP